MLVDPPRKDPKPIQSNAKNISSLCNKVPERAKKKEQVKLRNGPVTVVGGGDHLSRGARLRLLAEDRGAAF